MGYQTFVRKVMVLVASVDVMGNQVAKLLAGGGGREALHHLAHQHHGQTAVAHRGRQLYGGLARAAVDHRHMATGRHDAVFARREVVLPDGQLFYNLDASHKVRFLDGGLLLGCRNNFFLPFPRFSLNTWL